VLIKMAREKNTRGCVLLLGEILNTPGLADRLLEALNPAAVRGAKAGPSTMASSSRRGLAIAASADEKPRRRK
jgi:hypothetical protein